MQAVLITAYHNFNQLDILTKLLSKKFEVFVHIDKKTKESFTASNEHIHVYSLFHVNWGAVITFVQFFI